MRRALMRRPLALAVATVSVVTTLAAVPGSASAATGTLTVVTLGRDGSAVDARLSIIDTKTQAFQVMSSGKAATLPKGTYSVLTDIFNAKDYTDTMAGVTVNVSGTTKITLDARKGQPLKVAWSPAASGGSQTLQAAVCYGDGSGEQFAMGWNTPGRVYLIPNTSKDFSLATMLTWFPDGAATLVEPLPVYVALTGTSTLPANFTRTISRSGLTAVTLGLRNGPVNGANTDVHMGPTGGCAKSLDADVSVNSTPTRQRVYLSPGSWDYEVEANRSAAVGALYQITRTYSAGKTYGQVFFDAAWGPGPGLPGVQDKDLSFDTSTMFTDPAFSRHQPMLFDSQAVVTLRHGTTLLATVHRNSYDASHPSVFRYRLPASGWYSLSVDAHRARPGVTYPAGMLSPRTTLSMRFHADPAKEEVPKVFAVLMSCGNLTLWNQATPGSTTHVTLTLAREAQFILIPAPKLVATYLKSLTAQASFDGGKTWRTLKVTGSGSKWTAQVPNPTSGAVTLRTTVTSTTGDSSVTTIYRAYAIA